MQRLFRVFNNLPIERKLLLTSVIPIVAVLLLSLFTYRSVQTFSDDEEQLNNIYLMQRKAAEYMRQVLDLESGFRGYVLTGQEAYLQPYLQAHDRIQTVGDMFEQMVRGREPQQTIVFKTQLIVKRLVAEKDRLLQAFKDNPPADAVRYIEAGQGRSLMRQIREQMRQFDRLEQDQLSDALAKLGSDRSTMFSVILGGGTLALVLMVLTLHLIAGSITGPLAGLAKTVRSVAGGVVPAVAALDRRDEIGDLTRVLNVMNAQIREHLARVEKSEAELRVLNQDLLASESKYRSIVDHAPFGIFTARGMSMVFSNKYNWVLAGLDPEKDDDPEAVRLAIHHEDRDRVLKELAQAAEHNRPYETVFRFLHKDGTIRKVLSRWIPIQDADGHTVMYQGFNVDITAWDQMQARLSRAERLATLGQMAAGIAHEIRNPLVGIGSTTALLLEEAEAADPRRPELEIILNETKRLDRIVNQIIDYAKPRAFAPTVFALEDTVDETLALMSGALTSKHIKVECAAHSNLSRIEADRDQIKQVLLNVVRNAVEALEEKGTLRVAAFDHARKQEPGLMVKVADTGAGIASEDLPHVFEPFFTTGKHRGTGLGLAICHNIIEAHHGEIQVRSQRGIGTEVRIWLPLRQQHQLIEL